MKPEIKEFLLSFAGCDGGDIGSPERTAIWICGIEWGGTNANLESVKKYIQSQEWKTIQGANTYEEHLAYPYGKVMAKLLSAIKGGNYSVENYIQFAQTHQLFVKNQQNGYFKMNLYPLWFRNTDPTLWDPKLVDLLNFSNKNEYIRWCRRYRFLELNRWMQDYQPKLIICFGTSYEDDFNIAFSDGYKAFNEEIIDSLKLKWKCNENGTIVAVLPFPNVARYGLQKNSHIQAFGDFLRKLLEKPSNIK